MEGIVISLVSKELANEFQHSYLVQKVVASLNILFTR
jgi:hypothetical protein